LNAAKITGEVVLIAVLVPLVVAEFALKALYPSGTGAGVYYPGGYDAGSYDAAANQQIMRQQVPNGGPVPFVPPPLPQTAFPSVDAGFDANSTSPGPLPPLPTLQPQARPLPPFMESPAVPEQLPPFLQSPSFPGSD
jgi:hypothetical protein